MKSKNIIIIILSILVVCLSGYIVYDKVLLNKDDECDSKQVLDENTNTQVNESNDQIKNLYDKITTIRKSNEPTINMATEIINLINETAGWDEDISCRNMENENNIIICGEQGEYMFNNNDNFDILLYQNYQIKLYEKDDVLGFVNKRVYDYYMSKLDSQSDMVKEQEDAINNNKYCVGYSYDDNYFYLNFYTGTYGKSLWYARNQFTGECSLNDQKLAFKYQLDRKTLEYEKK